MNKIGQITLTIDMTEHLYKSLQVIEELRSRLKQYVPDVPEDSVLRSLLLEITLDYLEVKRQLNTFTVN